MDEQDREHLENLLKIHRNNLQLLETQKANHGLHVPPLIINGINHEKEEIAQIELQLKKGVISEKYSTTKSQEPKPINTSILYVLGLIVLVIGIVGGNVLLPLFQASINSTQDDGSLALYSISSVAKSFLVPLDSSASSDFYSNIQVNEISSGKDISWIYRLPGHKRDVSVHVTFQTTKTVDLSQFNYIELEASFKADKERSYQINYFNTETNTQGSIPFKSTEGNSITTTLIGERRKMVLQINDPSLLKSVNEIWFSTFNAGLESSTPEESVTFHSIVFKRQSE